MTIAVGAQEGALHIGQERRSNRSTLVVGLRSAIITDVTCLVGKRSIEAHLQLLGQVNIGIEANVQAIHVIVFHRTLSRSITYREVVVSHFVTTLNVDAVVLGHRRAIDIILPVSVLVVLVIIVVLLALLVELIFQELELTERGVGRFQHFRSIAAVLACVHHLNIFWLQHDTRRDVGRDTSGHRLVAARLNQDHTVSTLGTIERRTIAHHRHLLNVSGIQVGKYIIIKTVVQKRAPILLVDDDIVDDHQRLCVYIQ